MMAAQGCLDVGTPPMFDAVFGDGGEMSSYRYVLQRSTRIGEPYCCWVMLNPSIATPTVDDPTIRRVTRFSARWGFHNFVVVNLFALRSTDPSVLKEAAQPIGPLNDLHIIEQAMGSPMVVCAWGNHGMLHGRDAAVVKMLHKRGINLFAVEVTPRGVPRHPLYLNYRDKPMLWQPAVAPVRLRVSKRH